MESVSVISIDGWHYYISSRKPILKLTKKTYSFFLKFIEKIPDPSHRIFLFAIYARINGSCKIVNIESNEIKTILNSISSEFLKYLEKFKSSIEPQTLKILNAFYYILVSIIENNPLWILAMVSEPQKQIKEPLADIMRVYINQTTGNISYTKPKCLE